MKLHWSENPQCLSSSNLSFFHRLFEETIESVIVETFALQRSSTESSKQIFPEKEERGQSPNFHIHVSVSDLYIPSIDLPVLLQEICGPVLGIYKSLTHMNVEIGTEAAQFPEKEHINRIFVHCGFWRTVASYAVFTYPWMASLAVIIKMSAASILCLS